jgi:hypothetical protein
LDLKLGYVVDLYFLLFGVTFVFVDVLLFYFRFEHVSGSDVHFRDLSPDLAGRAGHRQPVGSHSRTSHLAGDKNNSFLSL